MGLEWEGMMSECLKDADGFKTSTKPISHRIHKNIIHACMFFQYLALRQNPVIVISSPTDKL